MSKNIKIKGKLYPSTISLVMDLVGGKWKALILYHLKDGERRYTELKNEMDFITDMSLSLYLKQLRDDGLVSRKVYGKKPPLKVIYSLTDFGKTLIPLLEAMDNWGNLILEQQNKNI
ncbi:winged helix-turn-helix transcriptional regulator [Chryseobacterium gambrini]|uniref:Winged helix-turn-helix transcriptional regulator n=1 Tax=Chryseobacterium gambrini TaxID=373672 RepID=A0AAJ1VK14_9FLAO|nr:MULTISPECIES: winged helix-turn-helix transcriptional regulator [Chryseobacterium]MDN4012496.1 winged helix-turn-helix transcriptional regulator [Chryseobacterium gambrini]QWA37341.1 helix-turn-helix transcriptional regulator [Chryseobacterium sp. ZHDP1]